MEIKGFGPHAQKKLSLSSALIIGAGGLGSVVFEQLIRNGLGKVTIVDFDKVQLDNLHRQVTFSEADIGEFKTKASKTYAKKINADANVEIITEKFTFNNASQLILNKNIIIDTTDSLETRYLANTVSLDHQVTLVSGAVYNLEGNVFVSKPTANTPCYKCLHYKDANDSDVRSCSGGPILGPVVSVIGSLMAIEAIKELTEMPFSIAGNVLLYDASHVRFRKINIEKKTNCPACSDASSIMNIV